MSHPTGQHSRGMICIGKMMQEERLSLLCQLHDQNMGTYAGEEFHPPQLILLPALPAFTPHHSHHSFSHFPSFSPIYFISTYLSSLICHFSSSSSSPPLTDCPLFLISSSPPTPILPYSLRLLQSFFLSFLIAYSFPQLTSAFKMNLQEPFFTT